MDQLHQELLRKQSWYAKWHISPARSVVHWALFLGVLLGTFFVIERSVATFAAAQTGVTASQQTQTVDDMTSTAFVLAHRAKRNPASVSALQEVLTKRKAALLASLESGAEKFLQNTIPSGLVKQFPTAVRNLIEQEATIEGSLDVSHIDYPNERKSDYRYILTETKTKKRYALHFASAEATLKTGMVIRAHGKLLDQELVMAAAGAGNTQTLSGTSTTPTGNQNVIALLINFSDNQAQPFTKDQINGVLFTNPDSISAYYKETSFGQSTFSGTVAGWFTISSTSTMCDDYGWSLKADAAATAAGINLSAYNRRLYIIPWTASCGWGGLSSIGGSPSKSWSNGSMFNSVFEHELGHALGLYHASTLACGTSAITDPSYCTHDEYGDLYSAMGFYNSFHYNAPQKSQLTWVPSKRVLTIKTAGTYTVSAQETLTTTPQVLKVVASNGTSYYLEYRKPFGFDATLPTALVEGVSIFKWGGGNTERLDATPGDTTFANSTITDGNTFYDPLSGITITQQSHDAQNATVKVVFGPTSCVPVLPQVTITPDTSTRGAPGQTLVYTVSIKNTDSSACTNSAFSIAAVGPVGWSTTLGTSALTIVPGATGTAKLYVTSPSTSAEGNNMIAVSVAHATFSSTTQTVTYTVSNDPLDPSVSITTPTDGSRVRGVVSVSASATDNIGVTKMELLIDGALVQQTSNGSLQYNWDTTPATKGSHSISVRAYDAYLNMGSKNITVSK